MNSAQVLTPKANQTRQAESKLVIHVCSRCELKGYVTLVTTFLQRCHFTILPSVRSGMIVTKVKDDKIPLASEMWLFYSIRSEPQLMETVLLQLMGGIFYSCVIWS